MNKDQVKGAAKDLGGKIQEEVGKLVGSTEQQTKGLKNQAEGKVQEHVGDLKENVKDAQRRREGSHEAVALPTRLPIGFKQQAGAVGWLVTRRAAGKCFGMGASQAEDPGSSASVSAREPDGRLSRPGNCAPGQYHHRHWVWKLNRGSFCCTRLPPPVRDWEVPFIRWLPHKADVWPVHVARL